MRSRIIAMSALLALAALAPTAASADACYDVQVTVNGDAVVSEADCV